LSIFLLLTACIACNAADAGPKWLWYQEPSLWETAQKYQLVRKLPSRFGWEGPRGGRGVIAPAGPNFGGPGGKDGVNISNERLETAFWGTPDRLVLSLGKTDVINRAKLSRNQGKKPVGQILILAEDFAGAEQPAVSTSIHNGDNVVRLNKGGATADLRLLLTDGETNIIAIKGTYRGLGKPVAVRLHRHEDTMNGMPPPQGGSEGGYFWIRQTFDKDKTFPDGFDYCLMAKVAGAATEVQTEEMQPGLGAPVRYRKPSVRGSAATARLAPAAAQEVVIYATVVTRAEAEDTLSEARKRLIAAEALGYAGLLAKNEAWYRTLYADRECGRIFTGNIDDAKHVTLPYIYQSRRHNLHTYNSDPDPRRFESDANYNVIESDDVQFYGLPCFNEEMYTGAFVVGRDETAANYYTRLFNFWRPAWEKNAQRRGYAGLCLTRGYVPAIKNDVYWSPASPAKNGSDWACMVWSFKSVWDAWDYGAHDLSYLREQVYPSLRGIADFFASILKLGDDGRYHISRSAVREEASGKDAIDCIASAKWSFRCAIEAAQLLGVDADRCALWKERLDKVAPYYVIKDGEGLVVKGNRFADPAAMNYLPIFASLVEYGVNGKPVLAGCGYAAFLVNVADEVNLESPEEERRMALRSNLINHWIPMNRQVEYLLGDSPDMLFGSPKYNWIWLFGHSAWLMYYAQKSGVGEFARTGPLKTRQEKTIACWLEPERLCNSRSGTIFFFPCTPSDFDVAFKDFQARGGFLVSGERKGGVVTHASVTARRASTCRVMNPYPDHTLVVRALSGGKPVATQAQGKKYSFPAVAGTTYVLETKK
jgi:hypothetical protein